MAKALITGSGGLIGSEAVRYFCQAGFDVVGVDNDLRRFFFGLEGSTAAVSEGLRRAHPNFRPLALDIREREAMEPLFRREAPFDLIVHAAAQPSHDWAARDPVTDFAVNASATVLLLELTRRCSPEAVFVFLSTNKVYGDHPNRLPLEERETRWEIAPGHAFAEGIDESLPLDACLHSPFGASKAAADLMVQEYGRYFGLKTTVFRGGCLTGPAHQGVELHGFLSYLVRCVAQGRRYRIYGHRGKQVRDNIHAHDLVAAIAEVYQQPRCGEVYNLGGGRHAHCSVREALALAERFCGRAAITEYVPEPRRGDHIWYVSNLGKFQRHYPGWRPRYGLERTIEEIVRATAGDARLSAVS